MSEPTALLRSFLPIPAPAPARPAQGGLAAAAAELEVQFLSEMFKAAGLGQTPELGGGIGEDQFASFLRHEQARAVVRSGGIGLAEAIVRALQEHGHG